MKGTPGRDPPDFGPHYRVEGLLGEGAAALVFAARDLAHDRPVAIKVLRAELAHEVWADRFLRELRIAAALAHPHIVPVLDTGECAGRPFAVMPLLEGETLRARLLRELQLPVDVAFAIAADVAAALDYAHAHGVVHRDVKPENIMLTAEGAVVLDFGIAYAFEDLGDVRITHTGISLGTPHYMSPEQSVGERTVDPRTDVYSLACVIYEMLSGVPPFTGATIGAIRARHQLDVPSPVHLVRRSLPSWIDDALRAGLAKNPTDRPATATGLVESLRRPRVERRQRTPGWRSGRVMAIGLLVAVTVTVIAITLLGHDPAPTAPTWILVGAIEAPPEDRDLGAAVTELVTAELLRSPALAVVPAEQLRSALSAAGLPDTTTLTDSRAREVAVRTAVRAVVTGRVHRLSPDLVSLTLIAERAESGAELVRRSGTASTSGRELADLIARLGGSIRRELGDRSEELRSERLPQYVSTASFAAFRLYADGLAAQRQGNYDGAIHVLKRSVLDDTGFASSWALLAMTYVAVRQPDSAQWAFDHALANAERLEPPERDRLRGDAAYNVDHDLETAATAYRRFLDQRPSSLGGWNNLGLYLSGLGRHEDALGAFVHANSIDPLVVGPRQVQLLNVGAELVLLGRLDSADAISKELTGPPAEYLRMLLLNARNDWNALLDTAGRLADSPATQRYVRTPAQTHAAGAFAALGRENEADARLAHSLASSHGADLRWHTQARLLFDLTRGAAPAWEIAPELVGDTAAGAVLIRGVHAVARNHLPAAERELALLQRRPSSVTRTIGRGREYLAALIAWKRGDLRSARAIVPLAQAGEHDPFSVDRPSSVAMRWLAAVVLAADGATTEAAEMRRLMREPMRLPPSHFALRGFVMRSP